MSFVHLAGVTTPGAPDEIIDWFATFQAWMVSAGWTVVAGGGTQDITFRSLSEAGGLTKLYLRAWRDLVNVNRVYFRVQDDLAGTHVTTPVAGGYVDSGGVQFAYWMSGDMDAIIVCFKLGAGYRHVYAGMVIPFALTVPDETYRMIVANDVDNATILRDHDGTWDVDSTLSVNPYMCASRVDNFDGSVSIPGTYFGDNNEIAGQLMHISGEIQAGGVSAEDTIDTGRPGATTSWITLGDRIANRFVIRTGGVLPMGIPDGTFASTSGIVASYAALYNALAAFLVGRGWTDLGDTGFMTDGVTCFSRGESGVENIYVTYARNVVQMNICVQDDAVGTHRIYTDETIAGADFPINYWISGDKDCFILVVQKAALYYSCWWGGLVAPFPGGLVAPYPGVSLSEYSECVAVMGAGTRDARNLRRHDGVWNAAMLTRAYSDGIPLIGTSNPNAFDGTTYMLWPVVAYEPIGGAFEAYGQMKYFFDSDGGGLASLDTITVGAKVYTVFFSNQPLAAPFAIRTA